jgi:quercetin dioxygenase-like cupin family protein
MSNGRGVVQTDANGRDIRVRLRGEDSGGELAVIEEVLGADFEGPPLHVHPSFGEGFYVLEGELTFRMEDETVSGGPGTFVFAPRGVAHTFANLSGSRARALVFCAPAGFERYFEWLAAQQAGVEPPHERPAAGLYTRVVGPQIGADE